MIVAVVGGVFSVRIDALRGRRSGVAHLDRVGDGVAHANGGVVGGLGRVEVGDRVRIGVGRRVGVGGCGGAGRACTCW